MAEMEYQVDEMLFKMNALSGTSGLPPKPPLIDSTDTEGTSWTCDTDSGHSLVKYFIIDNIRVAKNWSILPDLCCACMFLYGVYGKP